MQLYRRLLRQYRPEAFALTRRDLLRSATALGVMLAASRARAAGLRPRARHGRKVVIVGAGFAGLACAYELRQAGYDIELFEARNRVGGRVLTFRDWLPGKNIEGGAELIGSNHPMWMRYAALFGLRFRPLEDSHDEQAPVLLGGKLLDEAQKKALFEELDHIFNELTQQARSVDADQPWLSGNAKDLDDRNLAAWLGDQRPSELARSAVAVQLGSDNGVALEGQSLLGMLATVKGGGLEKFWTDSEVYRCASGNDALSKEFARTIGAQKIHLNSPIAKIVRTDGSVDAFDATGRRWQADHIVLAVPPGTWVKIKFDPALPPDISPQLGVQVKYLCRLRNAAWLPASPNALSDSIINQTWDGTEGQSGPGMCLVGFSGGPFAVEEQNTYQRGGRHALTQAVARLYPKLPQQFVDGRFMDWPREAWTMGGYSCAAPGQITRFGQTHYDGIGRMQFAGEFSCFAFPGFMEGALQSGVRAARNIAHADGIQPHQ